MRSLEFREILMVSHHERRARKVQFHPKATVIRGENDTGKSSIIKTIFHTMGAEPAVLHPKWQGAGVCSLVRFQVGESSYSLYRFGDSFSLFSENEGKLGTYNSITNELGPKLAGLFDFHLTLVDQAGETKTPPPAFLFLPFYIDQDRGWSSNWSSFARLQQFKDWRKDLVYYHTGIRPNEWYQLNAKLRNLEKQREEPLRRERSLKEMMQRLEKRLSRAKFDIDIHSFKKEVDRLLKRCEALRIREEEYKSKLVELETDRIRLSAQRDIVTHARQEIDQDYSFADKLTEDNVDCPTCGASYANSFAERFAIALDQDRCIGILQQIQLDIRKIESDISLHRQSLSEASKELREVNTLLAEKQGKITLKNLIENEGKREVATVLRDDLESVQNEIAGIDVKLREVQNEIRTFENQKKKQEIVNNFRTRMRGYLNLLNVPALEDKMYKRIDAVIKETGSDYPRAILAYFLSVLKVVQDYGTSTFCPIVIDAPNQQEQDPNNIRRMLEVINESRPQGSQLILGLVDDCGIDFGGKIIDLGEKNYALSQELYVEISSEIQPYAEASLEQ